MGCYYFHRKSPGLSHIRKAQMQRTGCGDCTWDQQGHRGQSTGSRSPSLRVLKPSPNASLCSHTPERRVDGAHPRGRSPTGHSAKFSRRGAPTDTPMVRRNQTDPKSHTARLLHEVYCGERGGEVQVHRLDLVLGCQWHLTCWGSRY